MTDNQLRIFMAVSELGSFKQVADQHFISQRAVSKQMRRLEDELGVALFQRQANKITLTAAGKFFKSRCQSLLSIMTDTNEQLRHFTAHSMGHLSVGYFSPFDSILLRKAMYQLSRDIDFIVSEESVEHLISDVLMGNLDCAFVMDNYGFSHNFAAMGLHELTVLGTKMLIGVSTDYHFQDNVSLDFIKRSPIIYYSNEESTYLKRAFVSSLGLAFDGLNIHRVLSYEQLQLLVGTGQAISFYPDRLLEKFYNINDHIAYLPIANANTQTTKFKLIYKSVNSTLIKQFLNIFNN